MLTPPTSAPASVEIAVNHDMETTELGVMTPATSTPTNAASVMETTTELESVGMVRKSRAGRRPGLVWDFFTAVRTETNKTHAKCRYCGRQCAGVASRMATHILTKCRAAPPEAIQVLQVEQQQQQPHPVSKRPRLQSNELQAVGVHPQTETSEAIVVPSSLPLPKNQARGQGRGHDGDPCVRLAERQLVLACLLQGVPLTFLDDVHVATALDALSPTMPRLTSTYITTTVLPELRPPVLVEWITANTSERESASPSRSPSLTLVHRCWSENESDNEDGKRGEWLAIDASRRRVLLAEDDETRSGSISKIPATVVTQVSALPGSVKLSCCLEDRDGLDLVQALETAHPCVLVGSCLLQPTLHLWHLLLTHVPSITTTLQHAVHYLQTAQGTPTASPMLLTLATHLETASAWAFLAHVAHDVPMLSLPPDDMALGASLQEIDALLSPLSWLCARSECLETSASEFVVAWLWFLSSLAHSSLLDDDTKAKMQHACMAVFVASLEDHHLVALVLDPRIHGIGSTLR